MRAKTINEGLQPLKKRFRVIISFHDTDDAENFKDIYENYLDPSIPFGGSTIIRLRVELSMLPMILDELNNVYGVTHLKLKTS